MRNHPSAVMLFAAGFGTRMGALTRDRPKPLIEVGGRPLIDRALRLAESAGVRKVVVNTHYFAEMVAAHVESMGALISHETPTILETGGGLRHALPLLGDGPVFTLNSDAVWRGANPLRALAQAWNPRKMDALLMLADPQRALGHGSAGDFSISEQGCLTRGPDLIYTGAQIIKTDELLSFTQNSFSLNLLWDRMLARDRVFGTLYDGAWCDVGSPDGLRAAETMLSGGPHV